MDVRRLRNGEKLKNLSKPIIGKRGDLSPQMRMIDGIVKENNKEKIHSWIN